MNLCLRVDDIGLKPDKTQDRALNLAQRFHAAMGGRPYLGGVIPGILDQDGIDWLRSRPIGLTVAMHGWRHEVSAGGVESEFHDLDYHACRELLRRGKQILGKSVIDFIPPWNALPKILIPACADEGLTRIWGDLTNGEVPELPRLTHCGWLVPSWRPIYCATAWRMAEDRPSLLDVLAGFNGHVELALVTLHITWEASFSPTFDGVKRFVDKFGKNLIAPDDYVEHLEP